MKAQSHNLPARYQHIGNGRYYINFNIEETIMDQPEGELLTMFIYDSVLVTHLTRDNVISAIIRDRYSIDQVEAITNNYLDGRNALEFIKLQNYRYYAKSIADDCDQAVIDLHKTATVFEVALPLELTMPGGVYSTLADKMIRLKVPFISLQSLNKAMAYPSWISEGDLAVLNADSRVTINELPIFEQ